MIKIQQGSEEINSNGGNILIGRLISDIGLEKMNLQTTKRIKHGEIPHSDLVKMAVTLLANGRTDFSDIDLYRDDPLFKEVLGIRKVASGATFGSTVPAISQIFSASHLNFVRDGCIISLRRCIR